MKNIMTIFKKEVDRVFKDKRLIITLFILPGLFIFLIYSFMGGAIDNMENGETFRVAVVNQTDQFETIYMTSEKARIEQDFINQDKTYTIADINETYDEVVRVVQILESDMSEYKDQVDEEDWNLVIYLPEDIEAYDGLVQQPNVIIYSNPKDTSSGIGRFTQYILSYDELLKADLYGDTSYINLQFESTDIPENELIGSVMSSLLPMLVIMFLFSGAMSIGPESIAGEKERNTISTLLITPIKRSEIAIGKIMSLSFLSLISAVSSFIGISLSLPKLLNIDGGSLSVFGLDQYLLILAVLFSTIFVIVGIVSIISAYSRNLKEASTYIAPIYILTIIISVSTMFSSGSTPDLWMYVIPIYNAVQSLIGIMTFTDGIGLYVLITSLANTLYLFAFIFILNRMFQSEQIMFKK